MRNNFAHKNYWVVAEITKAQEKNGHRYLDLADSVDGKRVAEMSATMWFSVYNKVNSKLNGELNAIFKSGNKVLVNVRIEFHSIFGLKLNILDVDPSITHGEIEKKKKETIERLRKENLFDLQRDLYLPPLIKKIALIGSPNTSGYRDFLTELKENSIYTNFSIKELSATVQGERAVKEIVSALEHANQYNVDAIILVRGGGSKMDLNVFNDYDIAKAICKSHIPVITGIGHENDETVADLVAREQQITPTAVAKFLYVRIGVFSGEVRTAFDSILKMALGFIATHKDEFNHTSNYLVHFTQRLITENNTLLRNNIHQLQLGVSDAVENERSKLKLALNKIANGAFNVIDLKRSTELTAQLDKIQLISKNALEKQRIVLSNLADLLQYLNPEQLLKKGYTISTIENVDLTNFQGELKGATLKTLSDKNLITSEITDVQVLKDVTS